MWEGVSQCGRVCPSVGVCVPVWDGVSRCVPVLEGVSQCMRVCPSVLGCVPVCEGVPQCVRVCPSVAGCVSVSVHTRTHHTCLPARCVHVKADITHAALLTTRVFPTTLYI